MSFAGPGNTADTAGILPRLPLRTPGRPLPSPSSNAHAQSARACAWRARTRSSAEPVPRYPARCSLTPRPNNFRDELVSSSCIPDMTKSRRIVVTLLAVVVLAAVTIALVNGRTHDLVLIGVVDANDVVVTPRVQARLDSLLVDEGSRSRPASSSRDSSRRSSRRRRRRSRRRRRARSRSSASRARARCR